MTFLSLTAGGMAQGAEDSLTTALIYDWKLRGITDLKGTEEIRSSTRDELWLKKDGTFLIKVVLDSIKEAGTWYCVGDSLVLNHELLPIQASVDSITFAAQDQEAALVFFQEGKEVARQSLAGLTAPRRQEIYSVRFIGKDKEEVVLTGAGRKITLSKTTGFEPAPFALMDLLRGLFGLVCMLAIAYAFSTNRKAIDWRLVGVGVGLQLTFAVLVLKIPFVRGIFDGISSFFVKILDFTEAGSRFMFGNLMEVGTIGYIFAFQVLPTIVFFSSVSSLLYYLGILQRIVYGFAWVMSKTMRLSGAESLAAAGNIFLGQTESPFLVRPYLENMTRSEIMCLMTGGMATIAGGVFAAYIGYLGGSDPIQRQIFATHLLTASILSAPAAVVASKMLVPETEETQRDLKVSKEKIGTNALDAITNGASEGLKLAVNVGIMLLVFTALIAMGNYFMADLIGDFTGLNEWVAEQTDGRYTEFSLQYVLGLVFAPLAFLLGVPSEDIMIVGQLLGEKTIINEFVAYTSMGTAQTSGLLTNYRSVIIATYALCGFANIASIGIQIGGIGALAPNQRGTLAALGVRALIGGTLACFMTAAIAGMLANV
ncbi:MAG: nucleoside transporter C-terminal domain-containing protein [Bacteroidota bacterium]